MAKFSRISLENNSLHIGALFGIRKRTTHAVVNPTNGALRVDAEKSVVTLFAFNGAEMTEHHLTSVSDCMNYRNNGKYIWVNIDGIRREEVKRICGIFNIHSLIEEDILSVGQRSKMDVFEDFVYVLQYMLSYSEADAAIEREQISLILGKDFVLTFQDEVAKDAFSEVRNRLRYNAAKLQQLQPDFLYYSLIDAIVDDYFVVMDVFGEKIELAEDMIIRPKSQVKMAHILSMRKELLKIRRTIYPARDVISNLNKNDITLFSVKTLRYLKDIYDHILQATEMVENYREGMANLQDLHMNQANLKMNESMKVMAIVTCLLAPATVIGGVFGMNFAEIPFLHNPYGFFVSVAAMLFIPLWMIYVFKKRGWF